MTRSDESTADREIELTRTFDAPRELVWTAWTEVEHLGQWWGPLGFTITTQSREMKPGGAWRYVMHGPDGRDYQNVMTFHEVVPPERLSYQMGGDTGAEPINFQTTVTFEDVAGGKTKLTMKSVFLSKEARDFVIREYNAVEGGKQTLGRLAEHLKEMETANRTEARPFVITRVYEAPVDRMWSVWTERDHLMKWFGPKEVTIPQCSIDLRPGGIFHYCMRGPDGQDSWAKWTFREINKPERLEFLISFADENGKSVRAPFDANWPLEMLAIVTFAPHAGIGRGTVVRLQWSAFNATETEQKLFDAAHDSMQKGWTGTLDRLAEVLKS